MKSLEHIIRDIREGKCECEKKKESLEHTIRKVRRAEYESSFGAKDSKPVDEAADHSIYHVSWGPGLDHEVVAKHGEEAVSKAKQHLITRTPKLKDPKYSDTFNKKPTVHNVSKERSIQKEDGGDKLPGNEDKMDESISVVPANYQGNQFKSVRTAMPRIEPPKGNDDHPQAPKNVARQRTLAKERMSQTVKQHMHAEEVEQIDEIVPAALAAMAAPEIAGMLGLGSLAAGTAAYLSRGKGKIPGFRSSYDPEKAKQNDSYVTAAQRMKVMKPTDAQKADAAKAKMDIAPDVTSKPKEAPPVELPTTTGAPAAAPVGKTTTAAPPATNVGAQAKPVSEPVAKPATDAAPTTKPAEVSVPKTNVGTAAKAAAATAAATAVAPKGRGNYPSISGGYLALDPTSHGAKAITHKAGTKLHTAKKLGEDTKSREEIENMPRKGDRKSIEYVGRKDADPKSTKEKTSRLATIKNVIDEAKKLKTAAELDKPTKVYDYNKGDYIIINPDAKKNTLDVKEP